MWPQLPTEAQKLRAQPRRALQTLAALSGLAQENMQPRRRLALPRHGPAHRARHQHLPLRPHSLPAEEATAENLDVLLDLIDRQITYRSRYLVGVALAPVRDMVLLDPFNPRSVGFQIEAHQTTLADPADAAARTACWKSRGS